MTPRPPTSPIAACRESGTSPTAFTCATSTAGATRLAAVLVPYFAAGLRNQERCIWIAAEPLGAAAAKLALERAGVDADAALADGSLILRDFSEWYAEGTRLRGAAVVDLWLAEEARALADGYAGLRITGNVTFLTSETWSLFMEYEHMLTKAFSGRRIVTLCTYPSNGCGASNVLDVVHRHSCTLEHPDEGWQILTRIPA
ncbi:MAG TPA: MEDS domain-containing protein [Burkholderiales bacterium]|nr:MEDS domain-containing protein [Burkholderiales bacterium]